jgi:hypothetical protein
MRMPWEVTSRLGRIAFSAASIASLVGAYLERLLDRMLQHISHRLLHGPVTRTRLRKSRWPGDPACRHVGKCRLAILLAAGEKDLDLDQTSGRKGGSREGAGLSADTRTTRPARGCLADFR